MRTISFVIPVYNEKDRLRKTFRALQEFEPGNSFLLERIIFVDDGSTDNSNALIKNFISDFKKIEIKLISYSINKGKGYAVRKGLIASPSEYTLFFDVDMSTPLSELFKFKVDMEKGINLIIGTRKDEKSKILVHQSFIREFLGQAFINFTRLFLNLKTSDITCGFKMLSQKTVRTIVPKLKINGWGYDAELILLAERENLSLKEIPVIWANDPNSRVKLEKAVITTLKELLLIKWDYSVKPRLLFYPKSISLAFSRFASFFL